MVALRPAPREFTAGRGCRHGRRRDRFEKSVRGVTRVAACDTAMRLIMLERPALRLTCTKAQEAHPPRIPPLLPPPVPGGGFHQPRTSPTKAIGSGAGPSETDTGCPDRVGAVRGQRNLPGPAARSPSFFLTPAAGAPDTSPRPGEARSWYRSYHEIKPPFPGQAPRNRGGPILRCARKASPNTSSRHTHDHSYDFSSLAGWRVSHYFGRGGPR